MMACNRLALADFHLGILCALPKEGAAVRASFDRSVPRNEWPTLPHRTTFSYSYGVIGDCHIILGYLADGQYGTVNASALCGDFCHAFGQHVRDVILVGIAGGAPRDGDIRLGDVVVSTRVDEYDFGRAVQAEDGSSTFVVKENVLSLPSTYLASLLSHWRAESLQAHARGLAEEVDHILRSFGSEARASYSRPTSRDVLYRSDVVHPNGCRGCTINENLTVHRESRPVGSTTPFKVHTGIVGTANTLLKDANIRDRLRKERGVLCVEMEAGGVASNAHDMRYLVVRGICDYADTHKNDVWQEYACTTAAAFTRSLILLGSAVSTTNSGATDRANRRRRRSDSDSSAASVPDDERQTDLRHASNRSSVSSMSSPPGTSSSSHETRLPRNNSHSMHPHPLPQTISTPPPQNQGPYHTTGASTARSAWASPDVEWEGGPPSVLPDAAEMFAGIFGAQFGGGTVNGQRFTNRSFPNGPR